MMKRTTILLALFVVSLQGMAQKFLDIYTDNQVVSSVSTADVDSMTVNGTGSYRIVNFWKDDNIVHHAATAAIDSIKVYRPQDDPLVYLGIVGFNQELYEKPIGVLGTNTAGSYKSFVSGLSRKDGTLLYYAVDDGLDMLTSYNFETPLNNIYLITFTDGLDQGSLMMNGNYASSNDYLTAVSNRIGNTRIKGLPLTAYSIGLRGSDVTDYAMFQNNLKRLASSNDKAFEVNSLTDVNSRLQEIAATINSSITTKTYTTTQTISLKIPGIDSGSRICFTFDGKTPTNSSTYIEGTFNLQNRSLTNVVYRGISGATTGATVQGTQNGIFVTFTFNFVKVQNTSGAVTIPTNNVSEYYKTPTATSWQINSEFTSANNTQSDIKTTVDVKRTGATVLFVLDCSNSLGSQFSDMKTYVNDFIQRVADNTVPYVERPFGFGLKPLPNNGVITVNGVSFKMIKVSGGTFQMGKSADGNDETPVHDVTLSDYYIGQTEVTQELWQAVMGSNPSFFNGNKLPVEEVSWNDCQKFITKLNQLTGYNFRLPTEAEWEFAAKGGTQSRGYTYSGSNTIGDVAWYNSNSSRKTHEVATKAPNELGIYDMSGNVWEWCQDWGGDYSSSSQTNPTGPSSGSFRVARGGGWNISATYCRTAVRAYNAPSGGDNYMGFRLAHSSP